MAMSSGLAIYLDECRTKVKQQPMLSTAAALFQTNASLETPAHKDGFAEKYKALLAE